ncbi:hypothetical protein BIV60_11530 [Bacillus sp. MUM 116]|uniref:DUF1116 domain-containing protein n=1 Tax=Bacillus sp. MUM 116 TaxID=1678002 RepID=UPI0008F5B5A9|nr:DUF1116 domain-containing protein [Bacillus sp. MUM 116]OIK14456.1 hypothetical protein BIV60_11530 [Bacillus sp. MUM 116]
MSKRSEANEKVLKVFQDSDVRLMGMGIAKDVIPGMQDKMILHAGPPIEWNRMCGPMKGAIVGAILYEGLAKTEDEAYALAESGEIEFDSNHEHQSVAPMGGIISPNMPVFIMKNMTYGNDSYSNVNEGPGKALRFGAYGESVIERLHWMRNTLYPVLKQAIELSGSIDIKAIATQAMQMGDDNHNRHKASTSLFMRELAKFLVMVDAPKEDVYAVAEHIEKIDMFNVNLVMAMCKAMADAATGIEGSTLVTVMARNGVDFGIKVSGTGNKWFTAPANIPTGLYFPGFTEDDAAPDIGDSAITETYGMGGFALAAAPAIVQFIGGTYQDGVNITNEMFEITAVENNNFKMPTMDFRGTPTGIDIVKVLKTGIEPTITTGMAHKDPGIGQVGAGIVKAPMECFVQAAESFLTHI